MGLSKGLATVVLLLACSSCGGEVDSNSSGDADTADVLAKCETSPLSYEEYVTREQLLELFVGSWQRCTSPQAPDEDVGVEFTSDGLWHALTRDAEENVVRRVGIDYGGTWTYFPAGSTNPVSNTPSPFAFMVLDEVLTDAPVFTNDPRQLRIMFSPMLSTYIPLDL